jgi:peptidoglycan/LPS O-acetylase OafA/YrhL
MVSAERTGATPLNPASNELRYEEYLEASHRPAFDGMRGIGFLLVITAHIPSMPLFGYLQGWTAVWLFFAISGYLVTMLLMREEKNHGRVAFGPFLVKRFFRIVPSYWIAILIYWLACFALPPLDDYEWFMERLPYFLGFMPEYANANGYGIFTHSWTVGVELKFYLLFPPVVFLMIKNGNWRFAVTAIMAALLTAIGSFNAQSYCAILFGAMLALGLERPRGYAVIAVLTRVPVVVPLGFVIALFIMLRYTEQLTVVALVASYLVAYGILQQSVLLRILTWKPLVYLGQRSYGAYLLHFLAIRIGYLAFGNDTAIGGFLTACFCLAITMPAAELMYQAIERPGINYGRRLLSRMVPSPASLVADQVRFRC